MLPTKGQMQSYMTQLKVGMSKPIVCYDTESNSQAARTCFNLQSWGFTDVKVLDGGLKAWGDNPTESKLEQGSDSVLNLVFNDSQLCNYEDLKNHEG